jgi:hypothetical protein
MGLSDEEYGKVVGVLGRHPTYTEVGMYAVMWSEHCGYKYSRPVLRLFKKYKEALDGAGLENAGVIDIGHGHIRTITREPNRDGLRQTRRAARYYGDASIKIEKLVGHPSPTRTSASPPTSG